MAPLGKRTLTFSIIATSSSKERGNIPKRPHPTPSGLQTHCLTLVFSKNWVFHSTRLHVANSAFSRHLAPRVSGMSGGTVCFLNSCHGEITQHGPGPSSTTLASLGSFSLGWGLGAQTDIKGGSRPWFGEEGTVPSCPTPTPRTPKLTGRDKEGGRAFPQPDPIRKEFERGTICARLCALKGRPELQSQAY